MERKTFFVDVLLPLHLPGTYTYRVPQEFEGSIDVGKRVVVQFGPKRLYSALVRRVHENVPQYRTKYVLSILDEKPIVDERQMLFWEWMSQYYMCYTGDVMSVALPSSMRLSSESHIVVHPDFEGEYGNLSEDEINVLDALSRKARLTLDEVAETVGYKKIMPLVKTMIEKGVVLMEEELKERYKPRRMTWLSLHEKYSDEGELKRLFDQLEIRAQKQLMVLMRFMQLSSFGKEAVAKRVLTEDKSLSVSAIDALLKKEILIAEEREVSRLEDGPTQFGGTHEWKLSEEQSQAYKTIKDSEKSVCLLHGVTSSGKTEVYMRLMYDVVSEGKQVLMLLPEIALTTQVINRLRRTFGNLVGVYHSRFNTQERAEVWQRTANGGYKVLIGARSALFLPFQELGLVIVDEEHDSSYKQSEPAPRYNGRDSAIWLAKQWGARTLLGSATPSVESYYNAKSGKFGFAELKTRWGGVKMPEVLCVDMKEAQRKGEVRANFSQLLIEEVDRALKNREQVILFQNRRGFSPRVECDVCHWIPQCKNCDVSLVYHKATNSMRCHYCGYSTAVPAECPQCHSTTLKMRGVGTERIEDDLSILFPDARIERMDLDSTIQKRRYIEILSDFEERKIDILVGTQMVTKGLDFDNVSVVGIVSADNLISYPDFRSYERSFAQMTQVSGRAGRREKQGKVVIQTYQPYHQAIRDAMDNDYESMYSSQIEERRIFKYPPYYKLINVTFRCKEKEITDIAASEYATELRKMLGNRVLGPEYPTVARIRGMYLKKIMVRFAVGEAVAEGKKLMMRIADEVMKKKEHGGVHVIFDADPQ